LHRDKAFTLVELLVVIAVIALLMAILMPALQRVKRQAKVVVCQSNLRQWGLWFPMYTADNDDKFFGGWSTRHNTILSGTYWTEVMQPYYKDSNDVLLCPMAVKPNLGAGRDGLSSLGSTFSPWGRTPLGSYGLNYFVRNDPDIAPHSAPVWHLPCWKTTVVKSANNVPVFMDCAASSSKVATTLGGLGAPPSYEGSGGGCDGGAARLHRFCINRHDAHINGLFMDWSVRKVGLKELWTLKWQRDLNTANEWTIAGGVTLEDWPDWMRRFKDY